ncbi:cupin domain-containing protein [Maribacter halichondriae]|uniref:cupin domain-containing protein n=1 Tax=Maribacter halichondriae TaxID=2980554 RepID=UPI0023582977|nr:cupin domain-containing protein [Maribacter sp. Hal144]
MYKISNIINSQSFDKLKVEKLVKTDVFEILSISLEKESIFPEHTSPTDAQLIVLEGEIDFHIDGKTFRLNEHQHFNFPKEMVHWVEAKENSKFLIVR